MKVSKGVKGGQTPLNFYKQEDVIENMEVSDMDDHDIIFLS